MPSFVLYVRTDIAWGDMTEDTFLQQEKYNPSVICDPQFSFDKLLPRVKWWNRTFRLSYFAYRQQLKEIAESSRARVKGIDLVIRNRHKLPLVSIESDGTYFIPCDDDDWYHPLLVEEIRKVDSKGLHLVCWNDARFNAVRREKNRRFFYLRTSSAKWLGTNAYCLSSLVLRELPASDRCKVLDWHMRASKLLGNMSSPLKTQNIDSWLSATFKSPASLTNLLALKSPDSLALQIPNIESCCDDAAATTSWASQYLDEVRQLNRDLVLSASLPAKQLTSVDPVCPKAASQPKENRCRKVSELLNKLSERCKYASYLQIGGRKATNFGRVSLSDKSHISVDKEPKIQHVAREISAQSRKFDVIYIDSIYLHEHVLKCLDATTGCLNENGVILVHNCLPQTKEQQLRSRVPGAWTGDVWKAMSLLSQKAGFDIAVLNDLWGIAAVKLRPNSFMPVARRELLWDDFCRKREDFIRIAEWPEFWKFVEPT